MNDTNYLTPRQVRTVTGWPYPKSLSFCKRFGQRNGGRWLLSSQVITSLIDNQVSFLCQMEKDLALAISQSQEAYRPLDERDEEILRLRLVEGWKLIEIGNKFGLTRERVRQIVGNTGFLSAEMMHEKIKTADPMESNSEIAERLGIGLATVTQHREGWHIVKGESGAAMGNGWEKWAAEQLEERGHSVELQPYNAQYDILVDGGIKVDVKAATGSIPPSQKGRLKNQRYAFRLNKEPGREPIDFYFCIAADVEDVFIIPYDKLPMPKDSLIFCWPTARPTLGKYQKYNNRWDLLKPPNDKLDKEI